LELVVEQPGEDFRPAEIDAEPVARVQRILPWCVRCLNFVGRVLSSVDNDNELG
jgi:hypothetical protein